MIHLICPSNYFLMPYVTNYISILNKSNIAFNIVYWDRLNINEEIPHSIAYKDDRKSFEKSFTEYIKYYLFLRNYIKKKPRTDKYIIFSPQLLPIGFFIKGEYILDVRDYHKFVELKVIKWLINKAKFVVISSYKFEEFIKNNTIINHNFNLDPKVVEKNTINKQIVISNIGAIRDYEANKNLINIFGNKIKYKLNFHGDGPDLINLKEYVKRKKINNVTFTGKYTLEEEEFYYRNADVINLVRDNTSYNNINALPNRLYKAAKYNALILTTIGTALSEIVEKYDIGLSIKDIDTYEQLDEMIELHLKSLDRLKDNQIIFLKEIYFENKEFERYILGFMRG